MKTSPFPLEEAKTALLAMTEEAAELKRAVGGPITEAVSDWLAPQYALAARERLEILRGFVENWALLRRGNQ